MQDVVIISAARTAIGKFNGTIRDVPATQLGAIAVREAVGRSGLAPGDIEECLMGNVLSASLGQNPARQAAVGAGLPYEIGSTTINKVCGSGMKAVMLAANSIKAGEYQAIVAGGMENMNSAPYLLKQARFGYRLGDNKVVDHMVNDGLWDIFNDMHMGITAEIVAERFGVTREQADLLSLQSHQKAHRAQAEGRFDKEIVPVVMKGKKGDTVFDRMRAYARTPPWRHWRSCRPPSRRRAWSPPGTPPSSATGRPPWWSARGSSPSPEESGRWRRYWDTPPAAPARNG